VQQGNRALNSPVWVFHDNVGYVFAKSGQVELKNEAQSGSWQSINSTYSADIITEDVFSLWIDHGTGPDSATYEYIVVPGADKNDLQNYTVSIPVQTIVNTRPRCEADLPCKWISPVLHSFMNRVTVFM
jgi:chondroitin AC lyase